MTDLDAGELQNIKTKFGIVGNTPELNLAITKAVQIAKTDLPVLITGESGVGKEIFPKIIHFFKKEILYYYWEDMINFQNLRAKI